MKNIVKWDKIEKGMFQYKEIMSLYKCSNKIKKDDVFQRRYKAFYRMNTARKDSQFYEAYFKLLDKAKKEGGGDILSILRTLKRVSNKNEISFASKLLATIDTKMPVWDSKVRKRINEEGEIILKATFKNIEECVEAYTSMKRWYVKFMKSDKAKKMIAEFDAHFPNEKITQVKKIDFIFWQTT